MSTIYYATGADAQSPQDRLGRTGEKIFAENGCPYYEPTARGEVFHGTVTATGIAIIVIGTTPGVALYNPVGSGVNAAISVVTLGVVSGTFVLGTLMHGVNTNLVAAATTGTAGLVTPGLIGSSFKPKASFLYTCTVPATPTLLKPFSFTNATAATGQPAFTVTEEVGGRITLSPGATWSMHKIGADTTPLWMVSVTWQERPILTATY